jgi:hypothetical protein
LKWINSLKENEILEITLENIELAIHFMFIHKQYKIRDFKIMLEFKPEKREGDFK